MSTFPNSSPEITPPIPGANYLEDESNLLRLSQSHAVLLVPDSQDIAYAQEGLLETPSFSLILKQNFYNIATFKVIDFLKL
ncbi:hypothetical protein AYI69_g6581 [Smittium culicis]|uniref:Uncharacterized protein n=1 Tax=Smittium culicis TaxID=133412 RepID=A0A1R1XC36_9FUNG|nr:hypothetical protein AYI69_g9508 [Smittium culicis]OMJ19542.1 hypothetical protein AYI69_g6581 [Smittium culicis]